MAEIFSLQAHWWDLVLRGTLIYFAILLFMRLSGKREVGQFTPFDLAVLLILSEAVSPALTGEEKSVTGGIIVAGTLLACNWLLSELNFRSRRLERLLEGDPAILIRDGKVFYRQLQRNRVSKLDLLTALRENQCVKPSEVALAVLEPNGTISVKKCSS